MTIQNANDHPFKVALVGDADMYANTHPFKVSIVEGGTELVPELPEEGKKGAIYVLVDDVENPTKVYGMYIYDNGWVLAAQPVDQAVQLVEELPEEGEEGVLYYVPKTGQADTYDLYRWINNSWIKVDTDIMLYSSTGSNTDGAMTQDATTKMVFKNGNTNSVCIGAGADSSATYSGTAVGRQSDATGNSSVAVGFLARAQKNYETSIGPSSGSTLNTAEVPTSVGYHAVANGANSVAVGAYATATQKGQFDISTGSETTKGYNNSGYRLLTGLYDPQSDHDASTKGYVDNHPSSKVLSSSDYNWNSVSKDTTEPYDSVALWLLEDGLYSAPAGVKVGIYKTFYSEDPLCYLVCSASSQTKNIYTFEMHHSYTQKSYGPVIDRFEVTVATGVLSTSASFASRDTVTSMITDYIKSGNGTPSGVPIEGAGLLYEDKTNGKLYQYDGSNWAEIATMLASAGRARELTTDDYNYPTSGTANRVVVSMLNPGIYYVPSGSGVDSQAYIGDPVGGGGVSGAFYIVAPGDTHTDSKKYVYTIQPGISTGNFPIYLRCAGVKADYTLNKLHNFEEGLTTLSYGSSTWNDFITAYNAGKVVYCRASSNVNPATGQQNRMAFMAYVSNPTSPTSVEFQYVRSVSSKTSSAQCDQVFVYKLTNASGGTWTVETRDMASTIAAGANAELTYSGTTATINPRLYAVTGQNTDGGITQKLFTDTVGNIEQALYIINNGGES